MCGREEERGGVGGLCPEALGQGLEAWVAKEKARVPSRHRRLFGKLVPWMHWLSNSGRLELSAATRVEEAAGNAEGERGTFPWSEGGADSNDAWAGCWGMVS